MLYLPEKDWSPRFGTDFFTVCITSRTNDENQPENVHDASSLDRQKGSVYYNVEVKSGHSDKLRLKRRYSKFRYLYDEVRKSAPPHHGNQSSSDSNTAKQSVEALHFPPKTCFFTNIDDEFLDIRQDELFTFLDQLLKIPNYSKHKAVRDFLELDGLGIDTQQS